MMLYLCEKPSQARDIARMLGANGKRDGYLEGNGIQVTWCLGHLLEMIPPDGYGALWKTWRLETLPILPDRWRVEVRDKVGRQFRVIQGLLKKCAEVVIATDADREGETIGREVLDHCGYRGPVSRLWLSALDDESIRKALGARLPGAKTEPLYRAGLGRARADWLVGMNLTRAYTILGRRGGYEGVLTVGRVQTPTLKLVVDRDRLIENFKPTDFFEVWIDCAAPAGRFRAKWVVPEAWADEEGRCLERARAEAVAQGVAGGEGRIAKAETKRMREAPPLPLDLSTLQQESSRRWGMGAARTLEVAQALYETHKAITYPRTDCRHLPENQLAEVGAVLQALVRSDAAMATLVAQADGALRSKAWDDGKITAHHAMIPTKAGVGVGGMSLEESRLYDLVRRHYLAQFFPVYQFDRTVVEVEAGGSMFRASGNVEIAPGWKVVLRREAKPGEAEEERLPQGLKKGETLLVEGGRVEEKRTKPPNRHTEGTLIQAMKNVGRMVDDPRFRQTLRETSGIGTEATRAAIIENLLQRMLLRKEGKNLISAPVARVLVDVLPRSVTNPATTAIWEQALEEIAQNTRTLEEFESKAVIWVTRLIEAVKSEGERHLGRFAELAASAVASSARATDSCAAGNPCPACRKGRVTTRTTREGRSFLGCDRFPRCRFVGPS
ncbi:MAG: DNA topoisomerase III [Magnetococcales bacterium]|nr:DNA topoisomerase III [Magnetococcales bacterium]